MRQSALTVLAGSVLTAIVAPPVIFLRVWLGRAEVDNYFNNLDIKLLKIILLLCGIGIVVGLGMLAIASALAE